MVINTQAQKSFMSKKVVVPCSPPLPHQGVLCLKVISQKCALKDLSRRARSIDVFTSSLLLHGQSEILEGGTFFPEGAPKEILSGGGGGQYFHIVQGQYFHIVRGQYFLVQGGHLWGRQIFLLHPVPLINPRRACAARVTVVVCVCLSACLSVRAQTHL